MVRLDDASSKGARRSIAGGKPTGCDNVKAGSCMHPCVANRAYYLGDVASAKSRRCTGWVGPQASWLCVDRVRPEPRSGTLD
jgi:hypothetical protein